MCPEPEITIVSPCYNDGVFIREMYERLNEPEPIKLLIVDDGSTDLKSKEALKELEALNNVHVIWQNNQGPAIAIGRGLQESDTLFTFILGGDDLLANSALHDLANILRENPTTDFVYGDYITFGELITYRQTLEWDPWITTVGNYCSAMLMLRRSTIKEIPYPDSQKADVVFEDWDYLMRLAEAGKRGRRIDRVVFFYRQHGDSRRGRQGERQYRKQYAVLKTRHPQLFKNQKKLRRESSLSEIEQLLLIGILWVRMWLPPKAFRFINKFHTRLFHAAKIDKALTLAPSQVRVNPRRSPKREISSYE